MVSVFRGSKPKVVAAVVLSVAVVFCLGVSQYQYYLPLPRITLPPPESEQPLAARKLITPPSAVNSDVSGYDVAEVARWYSGSACSGQGSDFVGDQPFFPPCRSDIKPGVATWGRYPYLVGPPQYMSSSKNPCWEDRGQWKCLPYFYLIGVSKSGTSDLFIRLTRHPHVASTKKEVHFFDRNRYNLNRTFEGYINKWSKVTRAIQRDVETTGKSTLICGDASPSYFYDNYYWKLYSGNENCTEPRVTLAQHIYHLNPNVKVLFIIRHPVQRLYSRYVFDCRHPTAHGLGKPSPAKFHSFVVDGLAKFKDCFQRWSIRHCLYNRTLFQSFAYIRIQENFYSVLLEDWFRVVPRDQFLFIRFEDYARNMSSQLNRVFGFFGLSQLTDIPMTRSNGKKTPSMLPETERLLHQMYQPFIRRLAAMLNDRKFLWTDIYPPPISTTVG